MGESIGERSSGGLMQWFDATPQEWSLASLLRLKSAERKLVCQKLALITIQWSQTYIARSVFTMPDVFYLEVVNAAGFCREMSRRSLAALQDKYGPLPARTKMMNPWIDG